MAQATGAVIEDADGRRVILDLDASNTRTGNVQWTSDPIEGGAVATDHGSEDPEEFALEGAITRLPFAPVVPSGSERIEQAVDLLFAMKRARQLVTVTSGLTVLSDYVIANLSTSQAAADGDSVRASITFRQIKTVTAGTVLIPPASVAAEQQDGLTTTTDGGTKVATDATGEEVKAEAETSILAAGVNLLGLGS